MHIYLNAIYRGNVILNATQFSGEECGIRKPEKTERTICFVIRSHGL